MIKVTFLIANIIVVYNLFAKIRQFRGRVAIITLDSCITIILICLVYIQWIRSSSDQKLSFEVSWTRQKSNGRINNLIHGQKTHSVLWLRCAQKSARTELYSKCMQKRKPIYSKSILQNILNTSRSVGDRCAKIDLT